MRYELIQTLEGHSNLVRSVSVTSDAKTIISGSLDNTVKVWTRKDGNGPVSYALSQTLESHSKSVRSVSVTLEGGTIVSSSEDRTLKVWMKKLSGGKEMSYKLLQTLEGHSDEVYCASVTPDSKTIVSGSGDKTIKVWAQKEGEQTEISYEILQTLYDHASVVYSVSLTPDGQTIVSGSWDLSVKIWVRKQLSFSLFSSIQTSEPIINIAFNEKIMFATQEKDVISVPFSYHSLFFNSLITDYFYSTTFYNFFSKPTTKEALEYLLEALPSFEAALSRRDHSSLLKLHHGINPLFWFCLLGSADLLKTALKTWGYEQSIYRLCQDFDPFLYSIKHGDQDLLEVWADYFLDEAHTNRLIINDEMFLRQLMDLKSPKIQLLAIANFKGKSFVTRDQEPTKQFGLEDENAYASCESVNSLVTTIEKKRLLSQENTSKVGAKVSHLSTLIPIPRNLSELTPLINSTKKMTAENRLQMRPLILALYNKYRWLFYTYSFLNLIGTILFFSIIVFQIRSILILIPFFIIYLGMALFEMIDIADKGLKYFKSVYNWFDFILYPVAMGLAAYVKAKGYSFLDNERENFMVVLVLYLALIRAVSMLRVLDSTRYLILMILRVYLDMTPFFVVLLFYILGNGSILILISITTGGNVFNWRELKRTSDVVYNWGYGNWDDPNEMNDLTFLLYLHTGLFIGLVMFNLLIAIISGTYEQFTEDRVMIDLEEILEMLDEMANFLRVMSSLKAGKKSKGNKVYYHFLVPDQSEGELQEIQERVEEVGQKQEEMRESLETKLKENQKQIAEIKQMLINVLDSNAKRN